MTNTKPTVRYEENTRTCGTPFEYRPTLRAKLTQAEIDIVFAIFNGERNRPYTFDYRTDEELLEAYLNGETK